MKKNLLFLFTAIILAIALTGCAPADDIPSTIHFYTNRSDVINTTLKQVVDNFHINHSNINVIIITFTTDYYAELYNMDQNNNLPDIFMISGTTFDQSAYPNKLEPLDDLKVIPDLLEDATYTYNGKNYAIGQSRTINGIVYNKNIYDNLLLSHPQSLNDLLSAMNQLKTAGKTPVSLIPTVDWAMSGSICEIADSYSFAMGLSGNNHNDMVNFDDPCSVARPLGKAAWMIYQINKNGYTDPVINALSWHETKIQMASGNLMMSFLGSWLIPQIDGFNISNPGDISIMPFPITDSNGTLIATQDFDLHFAVSKSSDCKAQAKEFIDFIFTDSATYQLWMAAFGGTSVLKTVPDAMPAMGDFKTNNPIIKTRVADLDEYKAIQTSAGFDDKDVVLAALNATNDTEFNNAMNAFNLLWAAARK